jgi:hypothetical protein
LLHRVDQAHWPLIAKMRVPKFIPLDVPVPPSTPQYLLTQITWYASRLFKEEADQYDSFRSDEQYAHWLLRLIERVIARVLVAVERVEGGDSNTLIMGYHGLGQQEIDKALRETLVEIAESYARGGNGPLKHSDPTPQQPEMKQADDGNSLGSQIKSLRLECDLSVEELATAIEVEPRTVYKHLSDRVVPRRERVTAYEKLFSKALAKGHPKGHAGCKRSCKGSLTFSKAG